ncbi:MULTISPECIES: hypothetical protein [Pseudarthrobacter]|uniref:hypothetical protein n=1 Tax=Pseudarthrobacter TaxID=1742993 RepID=UPI00208FA484|nr:MULTISPECIES: hypothetical protein [unclassified Pseudarthrobacter]MCO4252649.1 hypothetical protein [Pseudarthrobacter sp. MDT3-9]MCO4264457.1 hypothetical protein [Pseudarthrobacter sp. MDT3-26]MCO4275575.1 hypothetical protein [Pseudarthrobacter sp. HLT3-5]
MSSLVSPIPGAGKSLVGRVSAAGRAPAHGVAADVAGAGDVGADDRLRDSDVTAAGDTGDDGGAVAGADVSARAAGLTRRLRYVMSVRVLDLFSAIA